MVKKEEKKDILIKEEFVNDFTTVDIEKLKKEIYEEALVKIKEEYSEKKSDTSPSLSESDKGIRRKEIKDKNILVPIMNVSNGKLIYRSRKTGSEYSFEKYGDIEYMELYELLTMRTSQRKFLDEPFIIVLDDEVADYLGLSKMYEKLSHATEIDGIFKMPTDQFEEIVKSAPKGLAHLIVSKAKEKIKSKDLDSVQKVQVIEEVFKVKISS